MAEQKPEQSSSAGQSTPDSQPHDAPVSGAGGTGPGTAADVGVGGSRNKVQPGGTMPGGGPGKGFGSIGTGGGASGGSPSGSLKGGR